MRLTVDGMKCVCRMRLPVLALAAGALLLPAVAASPAAQAVPPSHGASVSAHTPATEVATRKVKRPKGMTDQRLRQLIEQSFRQYQYVRDCDADPNCTVTFEWTRLQWRGSARHCIAGENYGECERWATAFIARTDLLYTETEDPDYWGKVKKTVTQFGYWSNGLKRVSYSDDYGTKESWCSSGMGCGKDLLVWQDEFKDWFYSFSNIGDCCSAVRLT